MLSLCNISLQNNIQIACMGYVSVGLWIRNEILEVHLLAGLLENKTFSSHASGALSI